MPLFWAKNQLSKTFLQENPQKRAYLLLAWDLLVNNQGISQPDTEQSSQNPKAIHCHWIVIFKWKNAASQYFHSFNRS
jgi:hypothetical protein